MDRQPVVAGRFYPGIKESWQKEVRTYLKNDYQEEKDKAMMAMVPHAGYMFSGPVAGKTLSKTRINDQIILLGPNHTGKGKSLAVWPEGSWEIPGEQIKVDQDLAQEIVDSYPGLTSDYDAHLHEHSLEVVLPFLLTINPNLKIVPISVSEPELRTLIQAGQALAKVIQNQPNQTTVIISSDMSHFIPFEMAKKKDQMAIEAILKLDPENLYQVVRDNNISMCGVLPMTIGLSLANSLKAKKAELVQYATSGDFTGDFNQVVGYAGIVIS